MSGVGGFWCWCDIKRTICATFTEKKDALNCINTEKIGWARMVSCVSFETALVTHQSLALIWSMMITPAIHMWMPATTDNIWSSDTVDCCVSSVLSINQSFVFLVLLGMQLSLHHSLNLILTKWPLDEPMVMWCSFTVALSLAELAKRSNADLSLPTSSTSPKSLFMLTWGSWLSGTMEKTWTWQQEQIYY